MSDKLPRRDFLLGWLGGLLAGWLGRSQAHAAPNSTPASAASDSSSGQVLSVSAGALQSHGTVVYSASGLPVGLSIKANTGLISGTIAWK